MWPGSEANILHQEVAYIDKYNGSEVLPSKVNRIMSLLDMPGPKDIGASANKPRPQLIAAYVPDVDGDGHRYGPNSTEIRSTIANADAMVGGILAGLQQRNLTNIVNVIVVSDHGMATTDVTRLIQLEDLIDPEELEHTDGWPLYGLRPKKMRICIVCTTSSRNGQRGILTWMFIYGMRICRNATTLAKTSVSPLCGLYPRRVGQL
jgi:predicted AlkP superfamily pyrophosphatase or phosphodiesterase